MSSTTANVLGTRCTVVANRRIGEAHCVMTCVAPEIAATARPGSFVNVIVCKGPGASLRRPFSVYAVDRSRGEISLLYSIVGKVTEQMSVMRPGDAIDLVGPLGNKLFTPSTIEGVTHVLVGGGYGVPPLAFLSREMLAADADIKIAFLIGARHKDLLLCEEELTSAGIDLMTITEDGSSGRAGRITDGLKPILQNQDGGPYAVYCCGPTPMMQAVGGLCEAFSTPCQVSVEVAMPCGIGECMECKINLVNSRQALCCIDGPVFQANEVVW